MVTGRILFDRGECVEEAPGLLAMVPVLYAQDELIATGFLKSK